MRNYRDRPTRYRHYFAIWTVCFTFLFVLAIISNTWWAIIGYLAIAPLIFAIWETGERQRDRDWHTMNRVGPESTD